MYAGFTSSDFLVYCFPTLVNNVCLRMYGRLFLGDMPKQNGRLLSCGMTTFCGFRSLCGVIS